MAPEQRSVLDTAATAALPRGERVSLQWRKCSLAATEEGSWTVAVPGLMPASAEPPEGYPGMTYLFFAPDGLLFALPFYPALETS